MRQHLCLEAGPGRVPMVHPRHFENGFVAHPRPAAKKPNYIAVNDSTRKWLPPTCAPCNATLIAKGVMLKPRNGS